MKSLVSIEGVEDEQRHVRIKVLSDMETVHGPVTAMTNPSPVNSSQKDFVSNSRRSSFFDLPHSEVDPHGFEGKLKEVVKLKYMFQDFRYSDTARLSRSDEVLKLKNFKKDATLKLSKSSN
ncbi:hypothetical protein Tco_1184688 [Tanacetum coccineum]